MDVMPCFPRVHLLPDGIQEGVEVECWVGCGNVNVAHTVSHSPLLHGLA